MLSLDFLLYALILVLISYTEKLLHVHKKKIHTPENNLHTVKSWPSIPPFAKQ